MPSTVPRKTNDWFSHLPYPSLLSRQTCGRSSDIRYYPSKLWKIAYYPLMKIVRFMCLKRVSTYIHTRRWYYPPMKLRMWDGTTPVVLQNLREPAHVCFQAARCNILRLRNAEAGYVSPLESKQPRERPVHPRAMRLRGIHHQYDTLFPPMCGQETTSYRFTFILSTDDIQE